MTDAVAETNDLKKSVTIPKWGRLDDPRKAEDVIGTVKRYKPFLTRPFGEVELTEFSEIDCNGAVILECFPSVGLVAPLCGKNIVKALKLPLIGVIESEHFPVFGVVQNEQPSHPARIYGNKNLVVFMSEMSLKIPPEAIRSIVDCIVDFGHRHRAPMIYSLDGIPKADTVNIDGKQVTIDIRSNSSNGDGEDEGEEGPAEDNSEVIIDDTLLTRLTLRDQDAAAKLLNKESSTPKLSDSPKKKRRNKPKDEEEEKTIEEMAEEMFADKVHYITTNIEAAKKMRKSGMIPVVDGIIPGTTGCFVAKAPMLEQDITVLLAPTSLLLPDPNSVLPILKCLSEMIPGVDLESVYADIEKEGTDLHKMISSLLEKTVAEKKKTVPFGMYG